MPLKKGDWVRILKLDREGTIAELLHTGDYKVAVKGLLVLCKEKDIVFLPHGPEDEDLPKKKRKETKAAPVEAASLDLHGYRVEEAMKIIEERISSAIVSGADSIRIVHGKGTGKIQAALHRYLKTLSVVKRFRLDDKNPGVTWVYF